MSGRRGPAVHGVLVVDKPEGLTSHDVVSRVRRAYHTRRVGHAGTLDPMATGVLVILIGEATKLSSVLTTQSKSYETVVRFGIGTDSLDADGAVTSQKPLPAEGLQASDLSEALALEAARTLQLPPQVSAIKVNGQRSYAMARKGEEVVLEPRDVAVHQLSLLDHDQQTARLALSVSKGYYVRALARDLGSTLGYPAHLTALRRTQSGHFGLDGAVQLPLEAPAPLMPLCDAVRLSLPTVELTEEGELRARQGKRLDPVHLEVPSEAELSRQAEGSRPDGLVGGLRGDRVIALFEPGEVPESLRVKRGINDPATESPAD